MARKLISHPLKTFIQEDLNTTISNFCEIAGLPQSTVSTYISEDKPLGRIPFNVINQLIIFNMNRAGATLRRLKELEDEWAQEKLSSVLFDDRLFYEVGEGEAARLLNNISIPRGLTQDSYLQSLSEQIRTATLYSYRNATPLFQLILKLYSSAGIELPMKFGHDADALTVNNLQQFLRGLNSKIDQNGKILP